MPFDLRIVFCKNEEQFIRSNSAKYPIYSPSDMKETPGGLRVINSHPFLIVQTESAKRDEQISKINIQ